MEALNTPLQATRDALLQKFGARVSFQEAFRGDLTAIVARQDLVEVLGFLRAAEGGGYRQLSDLTAVDWLPRQPRFELVYHLFALESGARLRLKTPVDESEPVPSITGLWRGANFMEREVFDMFGIPFEGHPHLERILTPDGFRGHPLRKDFDIGGEEVAFDIPHRKRFSDA
ncbi:MAG: NADH-quinone oxidoreductase subunit C [Armatimonadetes bacterium]|nr:NADH-quinone oxidoreductase subunit C [Armatimonadota bacterium]